MVSVFISLQIHQETSTERYLLTVLSAVYSDEDIRMALPAGLKTNLST